MLTGGHVADCTAGQLLLERMPACGILHADKAYDSDAIRRQVEATGAMPNIPPKANRQWKNCFSPALYKGRNAIERMVAASRTSGASPPATTGSPPTTSPPSASPQPSATGYESAP